MLIPAFNTSLSHSLNQSLHHSPLRLASESNKAPEQKLKGLEHSESASHSQSQNATQKLSEDELRQIEQLKVIDRDVRAHEAAHLAAAGGLARGGASFSYQAGPDGRIYAVGGEVSIDTSAVNGNPQATIQKAQTIRAAALAPAQPSSADHAAAAAASQLEAAARIELAGQSAEEQETSSEEDTAHNTETSTDESKKRDSIEAKPNAAIDHYQNTSKPSAPSDLLGQQLNANA